MDTAFESIKAGLQQAIALRLETAPDIGQPLFDVPDLWELVISIGYVGYVALYRHKPRAHAVYVFAFRCQR